MPTVKDWESLIVSAAMENLREGISKHETMINKERLKYPLILQYILRMLKAKSTKKH
jgi:hypothetical protein